MDPLFMANSYFRRRKFKETVDVCSQILERNPYDQAAWHLKTRALTNQVYVDEVDVDEEGIAEILMDDNVIANVSRPGTSLRGPGVKESGGPSQGVRPTSQGGRPLSGYVRPGTQSGRPGTMEQAIRTPRTAHTARPVTSASGRFVRLGTASMLSNPDGPFINIARINFSKYAARPTLAKGLFEYIFHHENDVRNALELAALATEACQYSDWWWKVALAKCYFRLGMYREAEKQLRSALKTDEIIDTYLHLAKVYSRLDQPLSAIDVYAQGLKQFPGETTLLTGIARINESLGKMEDGVKFYKEVLKTDNMHVEAIACIATHHFYSDQPEMALKFYRRLLQMGVYNAELFNNLGLCCFYAQQYDMTLTCFMRALSLADDDLVLGDVWFNIGHVALGIADIKLAYQCFRLALSHNNDHAEAYNNLGVLEMKKNHVEAMLELGNSGSRYIPENISSFHEELNPKPHVCFYGVPLKFKSVEIRAQLKLLDRVASDINKRRANQNILARSFFQASFVMAPHLYEPHYNFAILADQLGDFQSSYLSAKRAVEAFPNHVDSKELLKQLKDHFSLL